MKKVMISVLLVLTCLCLTGCGLQELLTNTALDVIAQKAEESGAAPLARQLVDGILARDADQVASALAPEVTRESIEAATEELAALLPDDAAGYTLTPFNWNMQTTNGQTRETVQFYLVIGDRTYLLETLQLSGYERLSNVHLQEIDQAAEAAGAASSQDFSLWSIIALALTLAAFAVIIWAFVDALRRPLNRRWLWLLLIVLGNVLLIFSAANGHIRFNFNLGLYLNATQIAVSDGGFSLRAMLPVGAIVYLSMRRQLQKPTGQDGFGEANTPAAPDAPAHDPVKEDAPESGEA